ncbi:uncharacterized protein DDB_G0283357 isoform X2 [Sitodiplosis mosellana]|uniref:uncharacterized protein DDB_G0283357 isoform X2 n=1 Tax=Sitodiplosis mosellana TaxID=263140 RepID=UPI002443DC55|nr:uncharacterized protein DDB_G0283357 isoform X2 [Sitodiplosis mosellana]XP_055315431.1 uncharacterized protein DDB_G0283357 isoform X2 [Sitodiplosis mosellana]XP_055315432.1 uncharacterized protein DDB_G0283357 isoform X2 [Sitodiplosis mosellana]XP_055315433.1 uncharacterized protein DDB_G0283357 isoform X2 [Sitodiplosis mosellana]
MAAASAGATQTGYLSGAIASSPSHLQQHHSEQQHQHSLVGSAFVGQQSNYVQRLNVGNYLNVKQHALNNSANVAPGWRRQLSEGEIVYFSPSGAALRKIEQIKDYLLRHGTCKCGLPCPLRPDYFFEFNPQVPNSPLQIPPGQTSNPTSYCLHHTRLIEEHNHLSKAGQSTNFSHYLSSNQKLNVNTVLNTGSISQASGQDAVFTSKQSDTLENQIESVTVSRTPPWRKNSILNQQQQQQPSLQSVVGQNSENTTISNANSRVPPLPQHLMQTQTQPPWQNETQNRRINAKKRPNFKEDPTGYLNHQTAILHSSILNVHSPELQDNESTDSTSQNTYRQSPMQTSRSSRSSADTVNLVNSQNMPSEIASNDNDEQQRMSVMQQQQQNQNVYIQQFDSNIISKNQMIIGSNGQPVRIVQNIYSNPNDFSPNSNNPTEAPISHPIAKGNEFIGGKRVQNLLKTQTVQIHAKSYHQSKSNAAISQQQPQSQQFSSLGQYPKVVTTQQTIVMSQSDQETRGSNKDDTENNGLPIDVTHSPNGVVQVHHNCDINEVKSQPQTILMKSNQSTCSISKSKFNDHQYMLPQKHNTLTRVVSVSQDSPVSSSTVNKPALIEFHSNLTTDRGPSQVGTISTSNESPPVSSPDTSVTLETSAMNHDSQADSHPNKLHASVYVAGQTSGKNTITSVLAGKAMTSTTTTNQFGLSNDRNRSHDSGISIQIHENRILRPAQTVHLTKQTNNTTVNTNVGMNIKNSNNRTIHPIVQENTSSTSSPTHLPNIQIQQPTNQIIMTSSGCQILVMPTQSNKSSNQMIIGQPTNANTLVVNSGSGHQQNVTLNPQNAHMIGNEIMQGINDSSINGPAHSNIIQGAGNNVVIQSPNLMQPSNNVITTNNANSNYIVSSPNAIQPMLLNNSNLLSHNANVLHHPGQNVIQGNANNILATANATKVLSNAGNLLSPTNILTNQPNVIATNNQFIGSNNSGTLLSPNSSGIVLNQLSNASYVIQPQSFTTVDGQVVNVINSDNGNQFVQQTQQRIILSPDSKRRVKKRKSTSVSPQSNSPQQSPTIQTPSQQATVLQITPQYHQSQSFQTTIEQQILLQNGQTILQPLNLIGQQLLVPAGLMMTSDTVLQIQNVAPCSLLTPQGIVQNKSFLSPNSANQQFIVNGQISPIGQMYASTPVGLVVPQSNGPAFVQQSTTIVQQQTTMMNNSNSMSEPELSANIPQSVSTQTTQANTVTTSPPDTTTHSPRSPERPESQRSIASDINMVQFVSSSEPDSVVSPVADSAQSPSSDYDRNTNNSYPMTSLFKPNETKFRRIKTPTPYSNNGNVFKMKPDSHESSQISQAASANSKSTNPSNVCTSPPTTFSVGELVWGDPSRGPVRGHTAWPGKIVKNPTTNSYTPQSDSTCWVRWFGGKPSIELVQISSLKSLSEGLDAHHKAQKDNRKGRKLNSQLEKAIQEAMTELDRIPTTTTTAPSPVSQVKSLTVTTPISSKTTRARITRATTAQQKTKLIRIAPKNMTETERPR